MELVQTSVEKSFHVRVGKKTYYVNYLNSDGQILGLLNRDLWEITDEDGEALDIYLFKDATEKEKGRIEKNCILFQKLISFCTNHFNDYRPEL